MTHTALYLKAYRGRRDYLHRQHRQLGCQGYWDCPACPSLRPAKDEEEEAVRRFYAALDDRELLNVPGIGKRSAPALRAWAGRGTPPIPNWVGEAVLSA